MTATDELRKLLDERGVEWYEPTMKPNTTWFPDAYGVNCRVKPWGDALCVKSYNLNPEQAIAATMKSDREAELEALAKDLYENAVDFNFKGWIPYYRDRFAALGIEVKQ